ncbi:protein DA1 isoform X2 [Rhodamnia argentea]|uniref:Protein DA1 isoform X2 n=1 Tax=Rhodamnia argentea TaxID=178133 RepID=A0ABM3H261_9MYRT|nr:protein DA1 isoform X2 [Rhodamnia argentea]
MGWFSKIFKGSSHKISEGHYDENYGTDPSYDASSTSGDNLSDYEAEDIDRAIALSLLEQNQNRANFIDNESQLKEDEQLAKAIQESLNFESSPQHEDESVPSPHENAYSPPSYGSGYSPPRYGNAYHPMPMHYPTGYRICAGCNTEIGHGRFLSCMNAVWHPECFRCHACTLPISEYEIPTNLAGLIEYRAHPFWSQKYCPSHEHDGTPRCCSCERMEPRETRYVSLKDGRKLCLECFDSAVMDTNECQPLYVGIQEFYEGLNMKVEQEVPLLLVERQALNEAREGEKHGHHHMPETRGLCLSEEQTIGMPGVRGRRRAGTITEPYELARRCEVTAVLVLYGLPRLLTGSILAHEMMHAWLRLKGYPTLRQDVEEGICQVLAHMWLHTQLTSGSSHNFASTSSISGASRAAKKGARSQFERKLGEFFKHQIESDTSPVYGDGLRAGLLAVHKYGLRRTLDHIRMRGNFPY